MATVIDCRDVIKIHKQGNLEVVALHGVDFTMEEGEFVSIVGKSGAGKSTLLTILAGLDRPSAGKVEVAGVDLSKAEPGRLLRHYRGNVGFLWQDFTRNLLPYLDARQNVELPMLLAGIGARKRKARIAELLEVTGLRNKAYAKVHTMSGGEQQRLALCVALALQPRLVLADEPTGELDTETGLEVYELLRAMTDEGVAVLVVTHDVALATRSDRVVRIADGRIAEEAAPPTTLEVAPDGSIHLPRDLLLAAGIEGSVVARLIDGAIVLERGGR